MVPVFSEIALGHFPDEFISFTCTALVMPIVDCTQGSGSSTLPLSENFLVFYFPFSQFPTIVSSFFVLKLVIYLVFPKGIFHFRCHNPLVVGLPSTKYV